MTALEFYDSIKRATRFLPNGSEFRLHDSHRKDFLKFEESHLLQRGYGPRTAKWATPSLMPPDTTKIEWTFGLTFVFATDAELLMP